MLVAAEANARPLTGSRPVSTSRNRALVAAINSVRTLHLLPRLHVDLRLSLAARSHSLDMLRRDYFGHGNFSARMWRFHVRGSIFGENLDCSSGVRPVPAIVGDWLASAPHRAIMLDPSLRRIGVAAPVGAFGNFGTASLITADFAGG
jgi:uncharacterized protein YkwD